MRGFPDCAASVLDRYEYQPSVADAASVKVLTEPQVRYVLGRRKGSAGCSHRCLRVLNLRTVNYVVPTVETAFSEMSDFDAAIAGWNATSIRGGLWLSRTRREAPADVLALRAEPDEVSLIVDAAEPDRSTDELIDELFPQLSGTDRVRLYLSAAADRYVSAAHEHGIDLIAAEGRVVVTPYGHAVVRPGEAAVPGTLPQWRLQRSSGRACPVGFVAPSPAWERRLDTHYGAALGKDFTVRRTAAGLALSAGSPPLPAAQWADAVWPDPDRITVVVDGSSQDRLLWDGLAQLLPWLPLDATDGIRVYWPRAAARGASSPLQGLAERIGADLIAPVADVSISGYGAVCHGPVGAAPWLRFGSRRGPLTLESLYPSPTWEAGLNEMDLTGLHSALRVEHIAAGLCVYRHGMIERGLAVTARSLVPDPSRAVIVVAGSATDQQVRQDVESVLARLPDGASRRIRLLLNDAGDGGAASHAQRLADMFDSYIMAPVGRWTATPDGRLKAHVVPASAKVSEVPADSWQEFVPRGIPAARPSAL